MLAGPDSPSDHGYSAPVRWFPLLIIVPLLELCGLIAVGSWLGFWQTVGLLLLAALGGVALLRFQGMRVYRDYRQALTQGQLPEQSLIDSVLMFASGVLLIVPGFLSDAVALLLLIGPVRRWVAERLQHWAQGRIQQSPFSVVSFMPETGPVAEDEPFAASRFASAPWQEPEERQPAWDRGDVVETEGVEVQSTLLLPSAQPSSEKPN